MKRTTPAPKPVTRTQFRGCLLGTAIGDALGYPTEFISSVGEIRARYGAQGIQELDPARGYRFTDDTQMTVGVARALLRGGADLEVFMARLREEFVAWAKSPENNRAPGGTCMSGCRALASGVPWQSAGVKDSKGCGAAMRAAPVGLYFAHDLPNLVKFAAAQGGCTHAHPTGIASSVAMAAAVAHVAVQRSFEGIFETIGAALDLCTTEVLVASGASAGLAAKYGVDEMRVILAQTEAALLQETDDVCALLGGAWIGEEAVATALWCAIKSGGDYAAAIRRGANSSGDSDSIACMAGAIVGAMKGGLAIPGHWRAQVEKGAALQYLADELFEGTLSRTPRALQPVLDFYGAEYPVKPETRSTR